MGPERRRVPSVPARRAPRRQVQLALHAGGLYVALLAGPTLGAALFGAQGEATAAARVGAAATLDDEQVVTEVRAAPGLLEEELAASGTLQTANVQLAAR